MYLKFQTIFSPSCQSTQKSRIQRSGLKVSVASWEEKGERVKTHDSCNPSLNEQERIQWGNTGAVERYPCIMSLHILLSSRRRRWGGRGNSVLLCGYGSPGRAGMTATGGGGFLP